jgi:hypothetical protein
MDLSLGHLVCLIDFPVYFSMSTMLFLFLRLYNYSLKSGIVIPIALLFLLRIALPTQDLFCFSQIFNIDIFVSEKNVIGNLVGIASIY